MMRRLHVSIRVPDERKWLSNPNHTVGTPNADVTPASSMKACRLSPSMCGPGMASIAPAAGAA